MADDPATAETLDLSFSDEDKHDLLSYLELARQMAAGSAYSIAISIHSVRLQAAAASTVACENRIYPLHESPLGVRCSEVTITPDCIVTFFGPRVPL